MHTVGGFLRRIACGYFIVMLIVLPPAAAWNVPGADHPQDCCFSKGCWKDNPPAGCSFTAKDAAGMWDWYEQDWRSYADDGHIYLLQNGIRILEEKGWDNWAAYLACDDNFQALADGATWADTYKGRWKGRVYITAFFGAVEKQVGDELDLCNMAGWDHYYSDYHTDPNGNGIRDVDEAQIATIFTDTLGGLVSGIVFSAAFDLVAPLIPVVGPLIQVIQKLGVLGIRFDFSPGLDASYPSTALLSRQRFDAAVASYTSSTDPSIRYWQHQSAQYDSLFQAGWAIHYAQDVGVIYHLQDVWSSFKLGPIGYYHNDYEDDATGLGDPDASPQYHIHAQNWVIGKDYDTKQVVQIIQQGALAVDNPADWAKAKSSDSTTRKIALQNGLKVSEQVTAALLAKYLSELGIPKVVPPFTGGVLDATTGAPVAGAYVFYREKNAYSGDPDAPGGIKPFIDQQSPWNYVRTDLKGAFSLQLKEGTAYLIRAELPGYRYSGYIDVSASEAMGQTPVAKTIEYVQPITGMATSTTNFYVYLTPLQGAAPSFPAAVPASSQPMLAAGILPSGSLIAPATQRDLVESVMTVRADTTVLAAQAPGEPFPLTIPGETYIEIECANLISLGTSQIVTSPAQMDAAVTKGAASWQAYQDIRIDPARLQGVSLAGPGGIAGVPATVPPGTVQAAQTAGAAQNPLLTWQFQASPDSLYFPDERIGAVYQLQNQQVAVLDTGYSPIAVGTLRETAPKGTVMQADGTQVEVAMLSYSLGRLSLIDGGQSLYENHLARVPAANARITVTMDAAPGYIGPDFYDSTEPTLVYEHTTKPSTLAGKAEKVPSVMLTTVDSPNPAATQPVATATPGDGGPAMAYASFPDAGTPAIESITVTTNSDGLAAIVLTSGSQSGRVRLRFDVTSNPGASGIRAQETLEFIVEPPITRIDPASAVIVPPSLGAANPRSTLALLYASPAFDADKSVVDTGICFNFSESSEGQILLNMLKCSPEAVIVSRTGQTVPAPAHDGGSLFAPVAGIIEFLLSIPGMFGPQEGSAPAVPQPVIPVTRDVCPAGGCGTAATEPEPFYPGEERGEPCDDGNACTAEDRVREGVCAGIPVSCDDGNPETEDLCEPEYGCVHVRVPPAEERPAEGAPCDDGNACTAEDTIREGVCAGVPVSCDDGNPETEDICEPEY
ncbi:MAG: hypothetical protein GKC04_03850, partial [Methanomicrobiales archaeon]|nr:hypothetical protein [Methanomicrobiales archaeon]